MCEAVHCNHELHLNLREIICGMQIITPSTKSLCRAARARKHREEMPRTHAQRANTTR